MQSLGFALKGIGDEKEYLLNCAPGRGGCCGAEAVGAVGHADVCDDGDLLVEDALGVPAPPVLAVVLPVAEAVVLMFACQACPQ